MQEFSVVGCYMENPEKPQNGGWALARDNVISDHNVVDVHVCKSTRGTFAHQVTEGVRHSDASVTTNIKCIWDVTILDKYRIFSIQRCGYYIFHCSF